ncbi:MAG: hypothetical protein ABH836_04085, partial [Candidatus Omnitrophota bacterium]
MRFLKTLLGILLLPVAVGTALSFYALILDIGFASNMFHLFERGVLIYLLFHVFVARPVYLYVLGHEFVHVLATWLSGGSVVSFNVTPRGGSVVTSKTNFFIELSPYFVPLYTLLIGPAFFILKAAGVQIPFMSAIFVFVVGITLAFHFAMTAEALKLRQSDVGKSGIIFSFVLIFIGNLIVVMAVFCPVFADLSFVGFIKNSWANSWDIYTGIYGKIME